MARAVRWQAGWRFLAKRQASSQELRVASSITYTRRRARAWSASSTVENPIDSGASEKNSRRSGAWPPEHPCFPRGNIAVWRPTSTCRRAKSAVYFARPERSLLWGQCYF